MCFLTWFWIKSFTRSMGAAAVLETAAETPPTDDSESAHDMIYRAAAELSSCNYPATRCFVVLRENIAKTYLGNQP